MDKIIILFRDHWEKIPRNLQRPSLFFVVGLYIAMLGIIGGVVQTLKNNQPGFRRGFHIIPIHKWIKHIQPGLIQPEYPILYP